MLAKAICLFTALSVFCVCLARSPIRRNSQLPGADWNQPFKPFKIVDNIYYVGTNDLACYLITSPAGHVLIDTALEESGSIVRANIAALGFKLTDIKIILSSHAHYDHVAGHANMKKDTGALVYASAKDAVVLESGGTKGFFPLIAYKPVKVDRIVRDQETVRLGNISLRAHLTPGHTEGNTTWTTVATERGNEYRVIFVASMSINPGVHLVNFPAFPKIAESYAKSFHILKQLRCDIFLGPHAHFFDMETKVRLLTEDPNSNPFVDPGGYQKYISSFEELYEKQLKQERAALSQP